MENLRVTPRHGALRTISFAFVFAMLSFGAFRAAAVSVTAGTLFICSHGTENISASTSGEGVSLTSVTVDGAPMSGVSGQSFPPTAATVPTNGFPDGWNPVIATDSTTVQAASGFVSCGSGETLYYFSDIPKGPAGCSVSFSDYVTCGTSPVTLNGGPICTWTWANPTTGAGSMAGTPTVVTGASCSYVTGTGAIYVWAFGSGTCASQDFAQEITALVPAPGPANPWGVTNALPVWDDGSTWPSVTTGGVANPIKTTGSAGDLTSIGPCP